LAFGHWKRPLEEKWSTQNKLVPMHVLSQRVGHVGLALECESSGASFGSSDDNDDGADGVTVLLT